MHPGYRIERVYLCREPVDFRKQINGLAALVEQALGRDPFGPALYGFTNRARNRIKVLYWDRNGFCLWQKRLEKERFAWPAADAGERTCTLTAQQWEWLLAGFDLWRHGPHKKLDYHCII